MAENIDSGSGIGGNEMSYIENKVLRVKEELHAMKNELCQYCGKYKQAHEGACDGCRWREK